ncbi:hypothetical protein [Bythopirellula polymerisocia]|nr:hypothetical protein [Bythopirellula polymerisocia]
MRSVIATAVFLLLPIATSQAAEPQSAAQLTEFRSKEGKFSVHLLGEPVHETTEVGDAKETQHQFSTPAAQGVYLVSYQDNPNLKGKPPKEMELALESGRDRLLGAFEGELLESKSLKLNEVHPGLNFRLTIPRAQGEARCRFYMVGTRLYQILVIGAPDFVNAEQATEVIDSFKLLP